MLHELPIPLQYTFSVFSFTHPQTACAHELPIPLQYTFSVFSFTHPQTACAP